VKPFVLLVALSLFLSSPRALLAQSVRPDAPPVNPDSTPAARALLHEIDSLSGHATLSGQHNFPNSVSRYSDRVYDLTGHYPAVFGQDFGFSGGNDKNSTLGRPSMIREIIRQYRSVAVIALAWHSVRPTDDEPVTFHDSVQGHLTDWEFHQVLTPGTDLYNRWARQVDVIAGYLQELQAAGVPVLFRAYADCSLQRETYCRQPRCLQFNGRIKHLPPSLGIFRFSRPGALFPGLRPDSAITPNNSETLRHVAIKATLHSLRENIDASNMWTDRSLCVVLADSPARPR
jgi:hypothetical protein